MSRRLLVGFALGLVLLTAAATGFSGADSTDGQSLDTLAEIAEQRYQEAKAASRFASNPVAPLAFGGGLGLAVGLIGGALFAYNNRGMR